MQLVCNADRSSKPLIKLRDELYAFMDENKDIPLLSQEDFKSDYIPDWCPVRNIKNTIINRGVTMSAFEKQIGGSHYKMAIQPVEFIEKNNLGFCVGNCIKYLCRYKQKNGKQDLEKAKHYIDLLIELEYGKEKPKVVWGNEFVFYTDVVCKKDYNPCRNIEFKEGELYQLKKEEGVMYLLLDGGAFRTTQKVLEEYFEFK